MNYPLWEWEFNSLRRALKIHSVDFPGSTYHLKYFFKLDYIELPIMYRQKFKNKLQSFSVNAGVVNSFLIKSAQGSASILNNFENRGTSFNPAVFNKFDIGIILRISYEFKRNLFLNFSFTRGFIRPYIYNSGELNYNEVFLVGISYKIH